MGERKVRLQRSKLTVGLAGVALVGGICLGGAQTAVAAPAADAAGAGAQPQPQSATDPATTSTVEQIDAQTTRTATTTTGTAVSTDERGATTTTTTEATDVEDRTAYGQQRVEDPSLPEGTEAVEQQGADAVTTDRTVKTTAVTEQPFQEKAYRVVDGREGSNRSNPNLYTDESNDYAIMTPNGEELTGHYRAENFRYALVNVDDPSDVHYSGWSTFSHYSMSRGAHVLTDDEAKAADESFWEQMRKANGKWTINPDELLTTLKANVLGADGTTVRVLQGEHPTTAQLAEMLDLDGDAGEWSLAEDGKHLVRTTVRVEAMPTVTVPGQDEVVGYNPAKPAPAQTPDDPADPTATAVAAPAAQPEPAPQAQAPAKAAPVQAAQQASATPKTSDGLGTLAGAVAVLPAALGLLAMALLKRRHA